MYFLVLILVIGYVIMMMYIKQGMLLTVTASDNLFCSTQTIWSKASHKIFFPTILWHLRVIANILSLILTSETLLPNPLLIKCFLLQIWSDKRLSWPFFGYQYSFCVCLHFIFFRFILPSWLSVSRWTSCSSRSHIFSF